MSECFIINLKGVVCLDITKNNVNDILKMKIVEKAAKILNECNCNWYRTL